MHWATRIGFGLAIALLGVGVSIVPISAVAPRIALTLAASPNPGIGNTPET